MQRLSSVVPNSLATSTVDVNGNVLTFSSPHRVVPDVAMDADPLTSGLTGETFTTSGDPIVDAATHYWSEALRWPHTGKAIHAQLTWPSSKNSIKQTKSALWHRIRPA